LPIEPIQISGDCFLCEKPLRPNQPFQMALAYTDARKRQVVNLPYHLVCQAELIADKVADEIEKPDGDGDDEDEEDELARAIGKRVGKIIKPYLK
jgi:hypothetical protein